MEDDPYKSGSLKFVEHSEFMEQMRSTGSSIAAIDNGWNLLHVATQLLPFYLSTTLAFVDGTPHAAKCALSAARVLLDEWKKTQSEE